MQTGTFLADTNDKGQRPLKLKYLFVVDLSNILADSFHGNCDDLVDPDNDDLGQVVPG